MDHSDDDDGDLSALNHLWMLCWYAPFLFAAVVLILSFPLVLLWWMVDMDGAGEFMRRATAAVESKQNEIIEARSRLSKKGKN